MTCAQLGLRPGVLGHAWLLPFYDSKSRQQQAQLVVGYQGLVELAHRSGKIQSLIARTVYANDYFDVDYGLEDKLVHKPSMQESRATPSLITPSRSSPQAAMPSTSCLTTKWWPTRRRTPRLPSGGRG